MGQSKGKIDYQKDVRIIKFNLISKKIIKTDEEFNKILLEEVKYLNNEIETITKELNEMRGKI
jgi:hypothetical protein